MALARKLPAKLPRRFARAPRLRTRTPEAAFELVAAERFGLRLRGLAGLPAEEIVPLVFPRCRSVHTFGMRTPIDIVWLQVEPGRSTTVIAVVPAVGAGRFVRAPRGVARRLVSALELPAGDAERLGLRRGVRLADRDEIA
jgi:uncharacterized protein